MLKSNPHRPVCRDVPKSTMRGTRANFYSLLLLSLTVVWSLHGGVGLIAHRGASAAAPENTMAAFNLAANVADFVETDAWPTKDGHLVIIHDDTVDRTTNGSGRVADLTLAEIKTLRANKGFGSRFADEHIPTAAELLDEMFSKIPVILERKGGTVEQYVRLIQNSRWRSENIITSFDYSFLRALKLALPNVQVALVGADPLTDEIVARGVADGVKLFGWSDTQITEAVVRRVHAAGCTLMAWTVNDIVRARGLIGIGVDVIYTDRALEFTIDPVFRSGEVEAESAISSFAAAATDGVVLHWSGPGREFRETEWRVSGDPTVVGRGTSVRLPPSSNERRVEATQVRGTTRTTKAFTVRPSSTAAYAVNLSVRMKVGAGEQQGIAGFTMSEPQDVMLRVVGPTLRDLGIREVLETPLLAIYAPGGVRQQVNEPWFKTPGLDVEFQKRGAFPLGSESLDIACRSVFPAGSYTAVVASGGAAAGEALLEVYGDSSRSSPKLGNLSARGLVDSSGPMVGGFVINGESSRAVLIRASGPALAGFGVAGYLRDPLLKLYDSQGRLVASNDDWSTCGSVEQLIAAQAAVGAFPFRLNMRDSALLMSLPSGSYTVHIESADKTGNGIVLLEMYQMDI